MPLEIFLGVLQPDEREKLSRSLEEVVRRGGFYQHEYPLRKIGSDEIRWIQARGRLQSDTNGNPARLTGVSIDITDNKRAEQIIQAQFNELEAIYDYAPVGLVCVIDKNSRCLHVKKSRQTSRARETHAGLGIGLALEKRLVDMHGGRITVESAGPSKGSTFTVYLPCL